MLSFSNASSHVVGDTDGLVLGLALGLNEGDTDGLALGLRLGLNVGDTVGDHVTPSPVGNLVPKAGETGVDKRGSRAPAFPSQTRKSSPWCGFRS